MPQSPPREIGLLVEHFFRHESGKLIAALSRVFGLRNHELVEDMVQAALVEAFQTWSRKGVPDNPAAWIHQVARRKVLDALKHEQVARRLAPEWLRQHPDESPAALESLFLDAGLEDSQLRMMFVCCHPDLARENQIALTLKTLCGFSIAEIARSLLASEETIKKRVQRARTQLADLQIELSLPDPGELPQRLGGVQQCLYLLFNEGYSTSSGDLAVRRDLCNEAIRLLRILTQQPGMASPATFALLALMLFHTARFAARTDPAGRILLLEEQDRRLWDQELIAEGRRQLDRSATGERISTYHLEAGIALLHCVAPSFQATDWPAILQLYDVLLRVQPSPVFRLNRAIVLAHIQGPQAGIAELTRLADEPSLKGYHLLDAALGELYLRAGDRERARGHFESARGKTDSPPEQELLQRKLQLCS